MSTEQEIESRIDGVGGLVNIYRAITGKTCARHVALGMATSEVSALMSECAKLRERNEKLIKAFRQMAWRHHETNEIHKGSFPTCNLPTCINAQDLINDE